MIPYAITVTAKIKVGRDIQNAITVNIASQTEENPRSYSIFLLINTIVLRFRPGFHILMFVLTLPVLLHRI
jgi:hypothetical protein